MIAIKAIIEMKLQEKPLILNRNSTLGKTVNYKILRKIDNICSNHFNLEFFKTTNVYEISSNYYQQL